MTMPVLEDRVRFVINLSQTNVENQTGGPFGAAIFERDSGRLVSVGVNQVVASGCSVAHAEMIAFMMAQVTLGTFDLGGGNLPAHELVTSAQMCAMCMGATPWSGVRRVVIAAKSEDVEELTDFDEGPRMADWRQQLEARGIEVIEGLLRDEARLVLAGYASSEGVIYNGRGGHEL